MVRQDELVRHMSNLPAYLQQAEMQKNVQEKALSFGVLDWKRLEKWKYNERMPIRGQSKASTSGNTSSVANKATPLSKTLYRKHSSAELHLRSSHEERLPDRAQQIDISQKTRSSSVSYPEIDNVKSARIKVVQETAAAMPEEIPSSTRIKQGSMSSVPVTRYYREKRTTKDNETYPRPKFSADKPQQIVLLVPKFPPKRRSSTLNSQLEEVDLAQDNQKRFSDCFSSQELHSAELCDEIPHSCPLPASVLVAPRMQSDVCPRPPQNDSPITARPSEVKCRERENPTDDCRVSVETSKSTDLDTAEQSVVKGKHSSHSRRLSFSLSRLSRSFSFKESSTVPQLSSPYEAAKSGPVSSEVLTSVDDYYIDKAHTSERIRLSSPFRRLLDPILKPMRTHSARMAQPSDKSSDSVCSELTSTSKPVQDQIHQTSTFQAILQLTIKNGLPYFRFVVDNSSDILAAAVKQPSREGNCSLTYTFYSVHEIKKKTGGWISHGSKERSSNIGYNIIAEMKSVYSLSDMLRESVLYTVDVRKGNKGLPEVLPKEEIAAIIVKEPPARLNGEDPIKVNESKQEGCDTREKENFNSTIAILPSGVHSSPNGSKPSLLIDRWKSGGLCDCGGWDIGCKLRIFTDKKKESNCSTSDTISSALERLDLFNQDGQGRSQPKFSLTPLKDGLYSVIFGASISSLEAFSIAAAYIISKKLPEILDMDSVQEAKLSAEPIIQTEKIRDFDTTQVHLPPKYVPSLPPSSPVGRI